MIKEQADFPSYESFNEKIRGKRIVIFGAGSVGQLLSKNLMYSYNKECVFFIDNHPLKQKNGIILNGYQYRVYSIEQSVYKLTSDIVIIIASIQYAEEMKSQLSEMGITNELLVPDDSGSFPGMDIMPHAQVIQDMRIVRLYNFKPIFCSNFGDTLNHMLLPKLFHCSTQMCKIENCEMVSIGSNLQLFLSAKAKSIKNRVTVWGNGFIEPPLGLDETFYCDMNFCAVRGNLTKERVCRILKKGSGRQLGEFNLTVGDPGLLVSRCFHDKQTKRYLYGLFPHYRDYHSPLVSKLLTIFGSEMLLIDATAKVGDIVDAIRSCEIILSSSLHGLIAADSFGIPNLWLRFSDAVIGGDYKFLDYYSAFGLEDTIHVLDLRKESLHQDLKNYILRHYLISNDKVNAIQNALYTSFPYSQQA